MSRHSPFGCALGLITSVLCAFNLASVSAAHAQTISAMRGLYSAFASSSQMPSILTDPNVDGVFLAQTWSSLEPQEGVYYWTRLDSLFSEAAAYGKKVSLGVQAGYQTPSWVYADGAQAFSFVWDKNTTSPAICSRQNIPIPWDPVFLSKWQSFVLALGARYQSNPSLASVVIYGANTRTVENTLPISVNQTITNGKISCTGPDYPVNWQTAGYTRTKMENALFQMQGVFAQAFPHTQLIAALNPGGFPPIDDNGNLLSTTADPQANQDLISYGISTIGGQYGVGNGGLSSVWVWPLTASYSMTIDTGYQTVSVMGSNLTAAANLALGAGAMWLELYATDILNPSLAAEITTLHQTLQ